jgi:hypothetical protein
MMMNHLGYEKLFFGAAPPHNLGSIPNSTRGGSNQGTLDYQNLNNRGIYRDNGISAAVVMPMNFEGSNSLKAESVFVSVGNNSSFQMPMMTRQS